MKVYCLNYNSLNNLQIVCNNTISPKESSYSDKCNQNRLKNNDAILSNWNFFRIVYYN